MNKKINIIVALTLIFALKFPLSFLSTNAASAKSTAAYIAYNGVVYDVTESSQWLDGDHLGHEAGNDLTDQMEIAPHSDEVMARMKKVGTLV